MGELEGTGAQPKKKPAACEQSGYVEGGWRERENLNVESMPENDGCSKRIKKPK